MRAVSFAALLAAAGCAAGLAAAWHTTGPAELVAPGLVSTADAEIRLAVSPDGRRMLWGVIDADTTDGFEVLESVRTRDGWSPARHAPFNSPQDDFDPAFAPDGRAVFFFSTRPGGIGAADLYAVALDPETGVYGAPENLGAPVNTPGDEWAPTPTPGGLLFASDGHGGFGGHDLFRSPRTPDGWGTPENLGPAVNTPGEDFDAAVLHDGHSLVLTADSTDGIARLYVSAWDGRRLTPRRRLGPDVNSDSTWTLGPSVAAREPGVLYVSAWRHGGRGGQDIYRVRYRTR